MILLVPSGRRPLLEVHLHSAVVEWNLFISSCCVPCSGRGMSGFRGVFQSHVLVFRFLLTRRLLLSTDEHVHDDDDPVDDFICRSQMRSSLRGSYLGQSRGSVQVS